LKKISKYRNLEDTLAIFRSKSQKGNITAERILKIMAGKEMDLAIICMVAPFCLSLYNPFLSIPVGGLIVFIGIRMFLGKVFWLPKNIRNKEVSLGKIKKISGFWIKLLRLTKGIIQPRLEYFCHRRIFKKINAILVVILGLVFLIPCPMPIANLFAAWSLLLLCFGLLHDDGFFVGLGYVCVLVTFIGLVQALLIVAQRGI